MQFSPSPSSIMDTVTSDSPLIMSILFTPVTDKSNASVASFKLSSMIMYSAQAVLPTDEPGGNVTVWVSCGLKSSFAAIKISHENCQTQQYTHTLRFYRLSCMVILMYHRHRKGLKSCSGGSRAPE